MDQSALAYRPMQIHRVTKYELLDGRRVFLLRYLEGVSWVMRTFTSYVDRELTESDLPNLAARLARPAGWEYKASALDQDLTITTDGPPHIVRDHLTTMYIGRIDGVHNFDPWE